MPVKTRSQTKKKSKKNGNNGIKKKTNICLIGTGGVGKTSLMTYLGENWKNSYFPNRDPFIIELESKFNTICLFDIMALISCGESLDDIMEISQLNQIIDRFLIMFDITNKKTFRKACYWAHTMSFLYPGIDITLLGNKSDKKFKKTREKKIINTINTICNDFDNTQCIDFEKISCHNGDNIDKLF